MKYLSLMYLAMLLVFASCHEELNQLPITSKTADSFYKTEAEIEEAVNATYSVLQWKGNYKRYIPAVGELPSDNMFDETPANDGGTYGELDQFNVIPQNNALSSIWEHHYKGIQRANIVLNRIEEVSFSDDDTKNARKGEMKFLRSLWHFNLVRIFGDVPLVTEEVSNALDLMGKGRQPKEVVYAQIEKDITEAISELPNRTNDNKYRVTKQAAQALAGKIYLTLKKYTEAKKHLDAVVNSGVYSLLTDVTKIFDISNEMNDEIIFAVQFAANINGNKEGSDAARIFSSAARIGGAKGHGSIEKTLYNSYDDADPRKSAYIGTTDVDGKTIEVFYSNKLTINESKVGDSESDWVVLRYAEVLLMLAEVENELSNPSKATTYLNRVRARVSLADVTTTDKVAIDTAIEKERRWELIGEGHRWFYLLRTGKALNTMKAFNMALAYKYTFEEFELLMPIPQNQILTDPSAIKQNPGY